MTDSKEKIRTPSVSTSTLRLPSSPTAARGGASPCSPVSRQFAHSPYLSANIIIATEDLNAAEYECMMSRGKRRDGAAPGSPTSNLNESCNNTFSGSTTHKSSGGLSRANRNVCRHFVNGNCNRGSSCRFYHPGSIHHVITPSHPRTPTQRSLTPLADLALQEQLQAGAHSLTSPMQSQFLGPSVGMLSAGKCSSGLIRPVPRPVINSSAVSDISNLFNSPLGSPDKFHAQRILCDATGALVSTNLAAPALHNFSNDHQVNRSGGFSCANSFDRNFTSSRATSSLQLQESTMESTEGEAGDGSSTGVADSSAPSAPHSPTTPCAYGVPVHRVGVRTRVAPSPPLCPSGSFTASF
ncbi:hypothetical protein ABL78_2031 [Leptomonas seymouri]|uniref:C3H1-type domain-containing protein n=1 Tax=Leptomonas seymouri TaxID=5684 RepID=A0A0N0P7W6_LEPSE|nr:hypothetical protein ABL78_2031 [Leptomonas seymouri]|eukprot:KPI88837.1 hypothetical protein ABL78_2031 [Leptomonas seymouri]